MLVSSGTELTSNLDMFFNLSNISEVIVKPSVKGKYLLIPIEEEHYLTDEEYASYFSPAMLERIDNAKNEYELGHFTEIRNENELYSFLDSL